ncbi:ATP-dependent zinc metalloprotease FtsH [Fusarium oxysporum f. sp. raphani]|uniref:ATP-dependent zinc metalloprotease FtsH n=1 Tax=Fusarium oxysporum f. sp. raphani TaxID=96318 RepID=A0A8J5UG93_FUSOX|nr:ATP-dependent zinc metalloprotease FtsH [Fusarium oxysporum f. sp. raphani]
MGIDVPDAVASWWTEWTYSWLILQISGPPGVGKTLTAETIAESCKFPLSTVAAGQIGVDPVRVESFLTTTFKIASCWKAILLIDEADVFLAQRSDNPQINALVSVFLRELEQFDGVLFLTTNRVQSFDEAMINSAKLADKLADTELNGREIRNTVFAAWSIAEYEGTVVQLSHLEDSIRSNTISMEPVLLRICTLTSSKG